MDNTKLQIQQTITSKAMADAEFKNALFASPHEALETIGYKFQNPNNQKIVVVDQTDSNKIFINIPTMPVSEDMELTDELLEVVAGGAPSGHGNTCNDQTVIVVKGNNSGGISVGN